MKSLVRLEDPPFKKNYKNFLLCWGKCVENVSTIRGKEVHCEHQRKQLMRNSQQFVLVSIA